MLDLTVTKVAAWNASGGVLSHWSTTKIRTIIFGIIGFKVVYIN